MLLRVYNLRSLFVRVLKNEGCHTEAIKSRYELLLIPAKMVLIENECIIISAREAVKPQRGMTFVAGFLYHRRKRAF